MVLSVSSEPQRPIHTKMIVGRQLLVSDEGIVVAELILRIILGLKREEANESPRLVAVHGLDGLITRSVVDVCGWVTIRLSSVPEATNLGSPVFCDGCQGAVVRIWDNGVEEPVIRYPC
jgi:hypothetical protein